MVIAIAVATKKTRFQISGVNQVTTVMKISPLDGIIFSRSRQATIIKPNKMSNSWKYQKIIYAIEKKEGKHISVEGTGKAGGNRQKVAVFNKKVQDTPQ